MTHNCLHARILTLMENIWNSYYISLFSIRILNVFIFTGSSHDLKSICLLLIWLLYSDWNSRIKWLLTLQLTSTQEAITIMLSLHFFRHMKSFQLIILVLIISKYNLFINSKMKERFTFKFDALSNLVFSSCLKDILTLLPFYHFCVFAEF